MSAFKEARAALGGWGATDCPLCGERMYGFEWEGYGVHCLAVPGLTHGICPDCLEHDGADRPGKPWPDPLIQCPYCGTDPS